MGGRKRLAIKPFRPYHRLMRKIVLAVLSGSAFASPAWAEPGLEKGFDGALRGCEDWVLNPASWAEGTDPFIEAVGLGGPDETC